MQTNFDDRLKALAEEWGADLFGVADLSLAAQEIIRQGGSRLEQWPRAISIGTYLLHPLVDQLPQRAERAVALEYRKHAYDYVNQRLDAVASRLGSLLQREGYRAMPVPASERVDDERLCAVFSHKLAAHLAGLGWIGKSCLLITPQAGPRLRLASVLTDAPLAITGSPMEERCGECQQCVEICPVQAFTGQPFHENEPRAARYDAYKCDAYFKQLQAEGRLPVCGMCLYICPYGRKAADRLNTGG